MKHLTQEQYRVSNWSGGKTIEIAIAPEGALYAGRDFLWRLSSATVDLDESDFTALPDYERWIALLCGKMRLAHNAGAALDLKKYEIHRFDGADAIHSWGRCTDFNLMLRKGRCTGEIAAVTGGAGETLRLRQGEDEMILYCAEGSAEVSANGKRVALAEKEAACLMPGEAESITLRFTGAGCVMTARMRAG